MSKEALCQIAGCGRTEADHRTMAHQFQPSERDAMLVHRRNLAGKAVVASDAVLRMTLVRKGLISYEDLSATEKELKAAGLLGEPNAGYRSDGGPHRKVRDDPQA